MKATSIEKQSCPAAGRIASNWLRKVGGMLTWWRPGMAAGLALGLLATAPGAGAQNVTLTQATAGEVFLAYPSGYSSNQNIAFVNTGPTDPINFTSITVTGTGSSANAFLVNNNYCYSTILAVGKGCNLQVEFAAGSLAPGNYTNTVTASYTDNGIAFTKTLTLNASVIPYPTPAGVPQLAFVPAVTAIAGTGGNYSGNGVPATSVALRYPLDVALDKQGNIFIADTGDAVVRVVYVAGTLPNITSPVVGNIYSFAGILGTTGFTGDGGAANAATLSGPSGLAFDSAGNLYISDTGNYRVRKVTMSTGVISTIVGNSTIPTFGFAGDGGPAAAATIGSPYGLAVDSNNNLYICDNREYVVRVVYAAGTLANITSPVAGNIYTYAGIGGGPTALGSPGFAGDGGPATTASIWFPYYITLDASNNLFIADYDNGRIREVNATTGKISTVAGAGTYGGGTATSEGFPPLVASLDPLGVTFDTSGNLYISDFGGEVYEIASGVISWYPSAAITFSTPGNLRADSAGDLFVADQYNNRVAKIAPAGNLAFGSINVGSTSSAMTLTLQNNGSGPLSFATTPYVVAGNFAVGNSGTCNFSTSLAVGATCTVAVTFSPLSGGPLTGTITFAYGSSTLVAHLTGTGVGGAPAVTFNPTSVAFGNQTVLTQSGTSVVALTNTGSASLSISSIALAGSNPTDFALNSSACGATLAAAASCNLSVSFTPLGVAGYSATISVGDNATGSPQTVALTGTGTAAAAPIAGLAPTTLAFGNQTTSTTSTAQTLTLSNTGTAALTGIVISITGTNPTDFAIATTGTTCTSTLAAAASCAIAVTFTPASASSFSATLSVADNGSNTPQMAALSGTGTTAPAPIASLTPSTIAFGNQTVATTSATQTLTLANTGNAALTGIAVSIGGAGAADFAINAAGTTCTTTLAASATCSIAVTFTPASATSFGATVSVADNATNTPQTATLSGTGTIAAAPIAALAPSSLMFGSQTVATTSAAQVLTLSNTGNAALTGIAVSVTGTNSASFTESTTCGTTLAAGTMCSISVTFTPGAAGALAAGISVSDNAAGSPQTATLSGTGVAPLAAAAVLAPTSLSFGNQLVLTGSAAQSITLSNPGTATLTGISVSVTGANSSSFAETTTCGTTLAAGASCSIAVTFTPATAGALTASISVADSATGSPQTATLTGTGTSLGTFALTGAPALQSVNPGGKASFTINVTPVNGSYSSAVTLSVTGLPQGAIASFAPASVTPGSAGASSVLTVQTSPQYGALTPHSRPFSPVWALMLLPAAWWMRRKRTRLWLAMLLLTTVSLGLSSCAGGYFGPPPQNFVLTVTGVANTLQQSTTVTLNVQ